MSRGGFRLIWSLKNAGEHFQTALEWKASLLCHSQWLLKGQAIVNRAPMRGKAALVSLDDRVSSQVLRINAKTGKPVANELLTLNQGRLSVHLRSKWTWSFTSCHISYENLRYSLLTLFKFSLWTNIRFAYAALSKLISSAFKLIFGYQLVKDEWVYLHFDKDF